MRRTQPGQTIVLFAVMLAVFLGMMALGLDLVMLYADRRAVQGVADLAALGGVLDADPATAAAAARAIITANGYTSGTASGQSTICVNPYYAPIASSRCPLETGSGTGLEVTIMHHTPTIFAATIGSVVADVFGRAAAARKSINNYAVYAGTSTVNAGIDWTGNTVTIDGRVHSNSDIKISGNGKSFNAGVTYTISQHISGSSTFLSGYPAVVPTQAYPIGPFNTSQFHCDWYWNGPAGGVTVNLLSGGSKDFNVDADGPWWVGGTKASNTLNSGIYCAHNGMLNLNTSAVDGSAGVTFVVDGTNGQIDATFHNVKPKGYVAPPPDLVATDIKNILFYNAGGKSSKQAISATIDGGGAWQGWMYAPGAGVGSIKVTGGSTSTLNGGIFGDTVQLSGGGWSFAGTGPSGSFTSGLSE